MLLLLFGLSLRVSFEALRLDRSTELAGEAFSAPVREVGEWCFASQGPVQGLLRDCSQALVFFFATPRGHVRDLFVVW
jgi:hypothetical protein